MTQPRRGPAPQWHRRRQRRPQRSLGPALIVAEDGVQVEAVEGFRAQAQAGREAERPQLAVQHLLLQVAVRPPAPGAAAGQRAATCT